MQAKIKTINNTTFVDNLYKHEFIIEDKGEIQNICLYDTTRTQFQNIKRVDISINGLIIEQILDWQLQIFAPIYIYQQAMLLPFKQKILYTNYLKDNVSINVYLDQQSNVMLCLTINQTVDVLPDISYKARFYNSFDYSLIQSIDDLNLITEQDQLHTFYPDEPDHQFIVSGDNLIEIPSIYYQNTKDCTMCAQLNQGFHVSDLAEFKKLMTNIGINTNFIIMWKQIQCSVYNNGTLTQSNDPTLPCALTADII